MTDECKVEVGPFERLVEGWVLQAIASDVTCFDQLVYTLPSVYPSAILRALERLAGAKRIPQWVATNAMALVEQPSTSPEECYAGILPTPHPLDYEWRFTRSTALTLLERALTYSRTGDTLVMLGVSTVFREGVTRSNLKRKLVLVDCNRPLLQSFAEITPEARVIHRDVLQGPMPSVSAHVVIADGPWYGPYLKRFLNAASQICVPGGRVMVSLPPIGTRAEIENEWDDLKSEAVNLGLQLEEFQPLALHYSSPFFERNALRAEGITNYPYDWRRGNLVVFLATGLRGALSSAVPHFQDQWHEEILEGVRFRVRLGDDTSFTDPTLHSILPGDILPTVSARDERRRVADVWTSGNRIFSCAGVNTLGIILRALALGLCPVRALVRWLRRPLADKEAMLVAQAISQVQALVKTERSEMLLYVG